MSFLKSILDTLPEEINVESLTESAFEGAASSYQPDDAKPLDETVQSIIWSDQLIDEIPTFLTPDYGEGGTEEYIRDCKYLLSSLMSSAPDQNSVFVWHRILTHLKFPFDNDGKTLAGFVRHFKGVRRNLICDPNTINTVVAGFGGQLSAPQTLSSAAIHKGPGYNVNTDDQWFIDNIVNNPSNINILNDFMYGLCMTSLRAIVKLGANIHKHVQFIFIARWPQLFLSPVPNRVPFFSKDKVEKFTELLKNQGFMMRGVLKTVLAAMMYFKRQIKIDQITAFDQYFINVPLARNGFHLIRILDNVLKFYAKNTTEFGSLLRKIGDLDLISQYNNGYLPAKREIAVYKKSNGLLINGIGLTFILYQFCRIFDGRCLLQASVLRNIQLTGFAIGMSSPDDQDAINMMSLMKHTALVKAYVAKGQQIRSQLKPNIKVTDITLNIAKPPVAHTRQDSTSAMLSLRNQEDELMSESEFLPDI